MGSMYHCSHVCVPHISLILYKFWCAICILKNKLTSPKNVLRDFKHIKSN